MAARAPGLKLTPPFKGLFASPGGAELTWGGSEAGEGRRRGA